MSVLAMPPYPSGTVAQQCWQQYSYLFQMAQQLNMALDQMEGLSGSGASPQQTATPLAGASAKAATAQYDTLKSLIVKTADSLEKTIDQITASLTEEYVAQSDFGSYVQQLSAYLEANPQALTQYYSFFSDLKGNVDAVEGAFSQYRTETEGYIRTGIVYYDNEIPVYGVAVGQNLTNTVINGQTMVSPNNFRAVFTATRLSFWQDATEVAYISNNRLYITDISVLGNLRIGNWTLSDSNGMAVRWIGG